ncbi:MAG: hypothetical protein Q7K55_01105 [Candidatus Levybacteria bacterium]|nr:hypothetical protein [Candidatus Levybacteria bacterium]
MSNGKLVYHFKINLDTDFEMRGKEKSYRIISIQENQSLSTFARAIVTSFGFDFDHCYGFYDNFQNPNKSRKKYELFTDIPDVEDTEGALGVTYVKVGKAFSNIGEKLRFLFDYGDNWWFTIELLEIKSIKKDSKYPHIVKKVGKAPEQYPSLKEEGYEEEIDDDNSFFDKPNKKRTVH